MEENKENKVEEPKVDEKVEKLKVKKKTKKFEKTPEVVKVNINEPVEKTIEEPIKVDLTKTTENTVEETKVEEQPIVEITNEETAKPEPPKQPELPEGIQKVVDFMKDTGGDLNDYINLNRSFEDYGDDDLLRSYYKDTKPHLNDEEINFLVRSAICSFNAFVIEDVATFSLYPASFFASTGLPRASSKSTSKNFCCFSVSAISLTQNEDHQ